MIKIILSITLLLPIISHAEEPFYSDEYKKCMNESNGVTTSMRDCIAEETKKQDIRLNTNYKKYISSLPLDIKENFIEAQRLWMKYRDANCAAFSSEESGGTLGLIINDSCYLEMTSDRANNFVRN